MSVEFPPWLRGQRPEHVARALLAVSDRLQSRLATASYGETDIDGRRDQAAAALADVQAIAECRPLRSDDVHARAKSLSQYREFLSWVTDDEIIAASRRDAELYEDALALAERFMSTLPKPRPIERVSLPMSTADSVEMDRGLGGTEVAAIRARADLMMAGYEVAEAEDGVEVIDPSGATVSTGHANEDAAWAWLVDWTASRAAHERPETLPG